jgi:hypothetical protein
MNLLKLHQEHHRQEQQQKTQSRQNLQPKKLYPQYHYKALYHKQVTPKAEILQSKSLPTLQAAIKMTPKTAKECP